MYFSAILFRWGMLDLPVLLGFRSYFGRGGDVYIIKVLIFGEISEDG